MTREDAYLSWVGHGLGIGTGALSILFDKPEILLDIFSGWKVYRTLLEVNQNLRGNQINNWNGQWLVHRLLNNEELWVKARELADELRTYEGGVVQAKSDRTNRVKAVLSIE